MNWHRLNLDLDGSVSAQEELQAHLADRLELRGLQDRLRLYATSSGRAVLRKAILEHRVLHQQPWLTFIGSGDYHHATALLLETLPAHAHPVTLVLIDNHPDWFEMPLRYHCGTWVATALRLPWVESVIAIGLNSDDLRGHEFWFAPFRDLCSGRIALYPYSLDRVRVPLRWPARVLGAASSLKHWFGSEITFDTVSKLGTDRLSQILSGRLAGKNVYISIDKDVLDPVYALTDWEQGRLTLDDLVAIIQTLCGSSNVVGADVCGEQAPDPLRGLWKRYDAGRLEDKRAKDWARVNELNQRTNLAILGAFEMGLVQPQTNASRICG